MKKDCSRLSFSLDYEYGYPYKPLKAKLSLTYDKKKRGRPKKSFKEKVTINIYRLPDDLLSEEYENHCKENQPIKEIKKEFTIKDSDKYSNWMSEESQFDIPGLPSGTYYIIASTGKASSNCLIRIGIIAITIKITKENFLVFLQDMETGRPVEEGEVSFYLLEKMEKDVYKHSYSSVFSRLWKKFKTDKEGLLSLSFREVRNFSGVDKWLFRGDIFYNEEKYEEAIRSYDKALEIEPDNGTAWYNRGLSLQKLEKYEESLMSYHKAMDYDPDNLFIFYSNAITLKELGRYEEGVKSYHKALELIPRYFPFGCFYKYTYKSIYWKEFKEGEEEFDDSLISSSDPLYKDFSEIFTLYNNGLKLKRDGKHEEAINFFNKAMELIVKYPEGLSLKEERKYENFFKCYEKDCSSDFDCALNRYFDDRARAYRTFKITAIKGEENNDIIIELPEVKEEEEIFKGYIYTDRPVYRPSQKVYFKGILRMQKGDNLEYTADEEIKIIIRNSKNINVYNKNIKTDEYGNISGEFTLDSEAPLGKYYIYCSKYLMPEAELEDLLDDIELENLLDDMAEFEDLDDMADNGKAASCFQVAEYRKPEFEIIIKSNKKNYVQGDRITLNVGANYYFGAPVSDKECNCSFGGNYSWSFKQTDSTRTDKNGKGTFSFEVRDYGDFTAQVSMTDESLREVTGSLKIEVFKNAFSLTLTPEKTFYEPGDKIRLIIDARDNSGNPVETDITLNVRYKIDDSWKDIQNLQIQTDNNGLSSYEYVPSLDGYYVIACNARDRNNNDIKGDSYFHWYAGYGSHNTPRYYDGPEIEIFSDRDSYEPGDAANIFIVSPFPVIKGLLTVERDEIYLREILDFSGKTAKFQFTIIPDYRPNVYVTLSFFYGGKLYCASKEIICLQEDHFLKLSIEPNKDKYGPGEAGKFILKTFEWNNNPVTSQVTLGVSDEAVYALVSDSTPEIQQFFYEGKKNSNMTYGSDDSEYKGGRKDVVAFCCYSREGGKNDKGKEFIRKDFPDTAYFNPSIITDQTGTAEVMVQMPDTLTTWRATARAVTKDTKVGENIKKVTVSKSFLVRLIMPRFFTERDETIITGIIHNYSDKEKTVSLKLEIQGGIELTDPPDGEIKVSSDGRVSFHWKVRIIKSGNSIVTLTALTDEESDGVELTVPVLPHGMDKFSSIAGITKGIAEEEIFLPEYADRSSAKCLITLESSLVSSLLSSLEYLIDYPYGCVEQTMSRFLPCVMVKKTLKKLDLCNEKINKKLPEMVKKGLERLYDFHNSAGGWGWWKGNSEAYITAYVVYGLALAKEAGYSVDESKIDNGIQWMKNHYQGEKDLNAGVYIIFSITAAGGDCKEWLKELYKKRQKLDNYSKAVLAISLHKTGLDKEAKEAVKLLEQSADSTDIITFWHGKTGRYRWTDNPVETTAYCLTALLSIKPESKLIPGVVRYLSKSRKGNYWYSTKDTAAAVMALAEYIKITGEMKPDFTTNVYFNGTKLETINFNKEDLEKPGYEIEITPDRGLLYGKNKLLLEMNGRGLLYYSVYLKYYTGEENIKSAGNGFKVIRTYYLLKPGVNDKESKKIVLGSRGSVEVKCQDIILVELNLTGEEYKYVIIEDPKPAGCEFYGEIKEDSRYSCCHSEVRDEKIAYFYTLYPGGQKVVTYQLRAETPGTFHIMPARAYLMYSPEIGGASDEVIIKILDT